MKKLSITIISVLLVACSNSGPLPIGKDTYIGSSRVSFSGRNGAKSEALKSASMHCAQEGKKLLLDNITSNECALRGGCGEAEITYMCLNENDSRFISPKIRKEADTVIQIQNIQ